MRSVSDENSGLNEKYYSYDYAPNYKLVAFDNDMGVGQYYATNKYISMHDTCFTKVSNTEYEENTKGNLDSMTVYDSLIFNPTLDLKTAKNKETAFKNMNGSINGGLGHEVGHTYQNLNYRLDGGTEVTVNINSYLICLKFYAKNADPNNYDQATDWVVKGHKKSDQYLSMIKKLKSSGIIFANLGEHEEYAGTDYGALFGFQLISAFGNDFIPFLNHYYRMHLDELTNNADNTAKLDTLLQIISKITKTNLTKFCDGWNVDLTAETKKIMNSFGTDDSDKITNNLIVNKGYEPYENKKAILTLGNYYDKIYHLPGDLKTKITEDNNLLTGAYGYYIIKKLENEDINFSSVIFVEKNKSI